MATARQNPLFIGPAGVPGKQGPPGTSGKDGTGGTTTTASYTQPAHGSTVIVSVGDATAAAQGNTATVAGTQKYTITNVAGLNVTLLNDTLTNTTSGTIPSGSVVSFGGPALPNLVAPRFFADLANTQPTSTRAIVTTDGYAAVGDGGEGTWAWNTGTFTSDGGTIVVPTGYATIGAWCRQWDFERVNAAWFGCVPDLYLDANTAKMQAAITFAGGKYRCFFPPIGTAWNTTKPLLVSSLGAVIEGEYNDGGGAFTKTQFRNDYFAGPIFVIAGTTFLTNGQPQYTTRNGFVWFVSALNAAPFITFSEQNGVSLAGLTALTVETMIRVTAAGTVGGNGHILASSGSRTANSATTSALDFRVVDFGSGTYALTCSITTTGGTFSITTGAASLSRNVDAKVAASWDGSFLRLYVNGVYITKVAATGTIVQPWWESLNQGSVFERCYNQNLSSDVPDYQLTGVRISNSARYTSEAGGTVYPPEVAPLSPDANTLALLTYDPTTRFDNFLITYSSGINFNYLRWQNSSGQSGGTVTIKDLDLAPTYGWAILGDAAPGNAFYRLNVQGYAGIHLYNNCYISKFVDCHFAISKINGVGGSTGWSAAIALRDVSGISTIQNCQVRTAWQWNFVFVNTSPAHLVKSYGLSAALGVAYVGTSDLHCTDMYPTDEGGSITEATFILDGLNNCFYDGSEVQNFTGGSGTHCFLIDGGVSLAFRCNYQSLIGTNQTFGFITQPTYPVVADGSTVSPVNAACDMLDPAAPGLLTSVRDTVGVASQAFTSDANQVATQQQYLASGTVILTGSNTATRNWQIPFITVAGYKRTWINRTGNSVQIIGASGTGVTIANGKSAQTVTDGTNVVRLTPDT